MERAFLVTVRFRDKSYADSWSIEESAEELKELVRSSAVSVVDGMLVHPNRPVAAYLVGKGKAEEIRKRCSELRANVIIFNQDLSFPQQRNLEEIIGIKVIDRTQLILDIFAQRAHSQEGKVQVELAQLGYLLPRLAGKGVMLSRLGGGIGTRGPGEQKLEVDRRRIRLKMSRLKEELSHVRQRRDVARQKRRDEEIPTVALIGYTNAGKTTLLNALTQADAAAENRLFTTLDPLSRRLQLPNHQPILLTDTVGFIHHLPHHLIEAFQATLEEVTQSYLLLHVQDASSPRWEEQADAVHDVLKKLDAEKKVLLVAFNKIDRLPKERLEFLRRSFPEAVFISALTGQGLLGLQDR